MATVKRAVKGFVALALLMAVVTGPAGASVLTNIGTAEISGDLTQTPYNLIYDSDQSLFWLDYSHGKAVWQSQKNWADGLSLTNIVTPGYTVDLSGIGWRLPTTVPALSGYNQSGSEMGYLYYTELGNAGYPLANTGAFTKLAPDWYWSGTKYAAGPVQIQSFAWYFDAYDGYQDVNYKGFSGYALAVRPGQLITLGPSVTLGEFGSNPVPEPSTYFLLGISLGVVGYARRRMNAR